MKVGDVVYYKRDWKGKRPWYLFSLSQGDLCTIILLRDGKITNKKGNEERFNSSIVNLDINEIEKYE